MLYLLRLSTLFDYCFVLQALKQQKFKQFLKKTINKAFKN